jgi:hypothetical protein
MMNMGPAASTAAAEGADTSMAAVCILHSEVTMQEHNPGDGGKVRRWKRVSDLSMIFFQGLCLCACARRKNTDEWPRLGLS